jgi:hypothetical protein
LETWCFDYKITLDTVNLAGYNNIIYAIMQEMNNDNNKFMNTLISMRILTQELVFHFVA